MIETTNPERVETLPLAHTEKKEWDTPELRSISVEETENAPVAFSAESATYYLNS